MDKKKTFAILALLEPECVITADAIGFMDTYKPRLSEEKIQGDTTNMSKMLYQYHVHYVIDTNTDRFFTFNAGTLVKAWINDNYESKKLFIAQAQDLNSLFHDHRLTNILINLLQPEFKAAIAVCSSVFMLLWQIALRDIFMDFVANLLQICSTPSLS